jgi:hypothetical protein
MDCGCGKKNDCISKAYKKAHPNSKLLGERLRKAAEKWACKEKEKLDCGCGCAGEKGFARKYLTGGKLQPCPSGWREDGLTCVAPCPDGFSKDDGLTCRKGCEPGWIDDGLTCRKPITSTMDPCPKGSKDIAGTCWGKTGEDCVDDCFKHPAPGCRTYQDGNLEWAGINWGPRWKTDCNLRCGQSCWERQGITRGLAERNLRITGGEVIVQEIRGKEIRQRIDWQATGRDIENVFKEAFGKDSELAKAFDPEKNGVAETFRRFGNDTAGAMRELEHKMAQGFRTWAGRQKEGLEALGEPIKNYFGPLLKGDVNDPEFWIKLVEVVGTIVATAATGGAFAAAGPLTAGFIAAAANAAGPLARIIAAGVQGKPVDGLDIASLLLTFVPAAGGPLAKGAYPFHQRMLQSAWNNRTNMVNLAKLAIYATQGAQAMHLIPKYSTIIINRPKDGPPPDEKEIPPIAKENQKTKEEVDALLPDCFDLKASEPGSCRNVFSKNVWQDVYRCYEYEDPDSCAFLEGKKGRNFVPVEGIDFSPFKFKTQNAGGSFVIQESPAENEPFDFKTAPLVHADVNGRNYSNPLGDLTSDIPSNTPPKSKYDEDFDVNCYANNYPELATYLGSKEKLIEWWTDIGHKNDDPSCNKKIRIPGDKEKCQAANMFWNGEECDDTKDVKGVYVTNLQRDKRKCKAENSYWNSANAICDSSKTPQGINKLDAQNAEILEKNKERCTRTKSQWTGTECNLDKHPDGRIKTKYDILSQSCEERNEYWNDKESSFLECYARTYPDIAAAFGVTDPKTLTTTQKSQLEHHYRTHGVEEGRTACNPCNSLKNKAGRVKTEVTNENAKRDCDANPDGYYDIQSNVCLIGQRHKDGRSYSMQERAKFECREKDEFYVDKPYSEIVNGNVLAVRDVERCDPLRHNDGRIKSTIRTENLKDVCTQLGHLWKDGICHTDRDKTGRIIGNINRDLRTGEQSIRDVKMDVESQIITGNQGRLEIKEYKNVDLSPLVKDSKLELFPEYLLTLFKDSLKTNFESYQDRITRISLEYMSPDGKWHQISSSNSIDSSGKGIVWNNQIFGRIDLKQAPEDPVGDLKVEAQIEFANETRFDEMLISMVDPSKIISEDIHKLLIIDAWLSGVSVLDQMRNRVTRDNIIPSFKVEGGDLQTAILTRRGEVIMRVPNGQMFPETKLELTQTFKNFIEQTKYDLVHNTPQAIYRREVEEMLAEAARRETQHRKEYERLLPEITRAEEECARLGNYWKLESNLDYKNSCKSDRDPSGRLKTSKFKIVEATLFGYSPEVQAPARRMFFRNMKTIEIDHKLAEKFLVPLDRPIGYFEIDKSKDILEILFPIIIDNFLPEQKGKTLAQVKEYLEDLPEKTIFPLRLTIRYNPTETEGQLGRSEVSFDAIPKPKPEEIPALNTKYKLLEFDTNKAYKKGDIFVGRLPNAQPGELISFSNTNLTKLLVDLPVRTAITPGSTELVPRENIRRLLRNIDTFPNPRIRELSGSGNSKSLTLYYADWCPHCKPLVPIFKKLKLPGVEIRMLEQAENRELKVQGYPTIVYRNGSSMEMYNGPRTKSGIVKFLKNKLD